MLKFIFFCLLIVNALLCALGMGYFANPVYEPHQPRRLQEQQSSERLKLISAEVANAPVVKPEPVAPAPELIACMQWGTFAFADLNRVEEKLKALAFGNRQSRQNAQDASTTMVFIPPLGSKDAADRKTQELAHLGVHDFFGIQDQSAMRYGISLGVFKSEDAARQLLAQLVAKGVHSARLGVHMVETNKFNFFFKNVSAPERAGLEKLKSDFPAQDMHACKAA